MRPRSILLLAAAVVVAVGLFVVLRPGDDDESASPGTTTSATTTETGSTTVAPPPPPARPGPARVEVTIQGGVPVGGPRRVTVAKGRRVVLVVTSDVADHVHLHGYDIMRDVAPGSPARIAFQASIVGTVEAELEDSGVQIAAVTTKP
ncbi:MAG TPA: hypothetical protein VFM13_05775 [Gaiellaceae bacterium]|nr:hypothetical protein [Gaiellaceae bacterium]